MTRDDVIRMARESGMLIPSFRIGGGLALGTCTVPDFERFAGLVAQAEREECARACEDLRGTVSMFATSKDCRTHNNAITCCGKAISARGEK